MAAMGRRSPNRSGGLNASFPAFPALKPGTACNPLGVLIVRDRKVASAGDLDDLCEPTVNTACATGDSNPAYFARGWANRNSESRGGVTAVCQPGSRHAMYAEFLGECQLFDPIMTQGNLAGHVMRRFENWLVRWSPADPSESPRPGFLGVQVVQHRCGRILTMISGE